MKSILIYTIASLLVVISACTQKKTIAVEEVSNNFLTPEIMCGTVQFTDGCGASTDTLIRFGLALLHHMTYEDAEYTFDKVIAQDPDCFWGHWGKAMSYIHPLWPDAPSEQELDLGYVLSQRALALAKKPKEKYYGDALAAFYEKGDKKKSERLAAFQQGWAAAHTQLPDDPEAELFWGLFTLSTVSPSDKTFAVQKEVGAMAERMLEKYPDHPGAFHYGIHAYDVPPLATNALKLARNYGKIAPEIPHALHMPSHIFTRLGLWQESIDWNKRSAEAALRLPLKGEVSPHSFHALDYMAYAYLQYGEDEKAKAILAGLDTLKGPFFVSPATAYGLAAIPARIPVENHDWKAATQVPEPDTVQFPWKKFPQYQALRYFARGIGGARGGDLDIAKDAIAKLESISTNLGDAPENKYWRDQVEIQKLAVEAWTAYAMGKKDDALTLMQRSAELENATQKNPVSPGELLPAGELLGDMLLDMKKPAEALVAYQKSLESRPNRFNSLYGAGKSAEESGNMALSGDYYKKLLELKGETATTRDKAKYAQTFVSNHG